MKILATLFCTMFLTSLGFAQHFSTWEVLNAGTTNHINDMFFINSKVGYIVGENYLFKKTMDGGKTWTRLTPPQDGQIAGNQGNIISIDYHKGMQHSNLDRGLYLTWKQGYFANVTDNDGASYQAYNYVDSLLFCEINGFRILPENKGNGYLNCITFGQSCKGNPVFYNYYDGPFSFAHSDSVVSKGDEQFICVARDSSRTLMGSSNGYIYQYPWVTSSPDSFLLDTSGITSIAYVGNHTWYASSNNGVYNMFKSVDSGKTFRVDSSFTRTFHYPVIHEMKFLSPQVGIIAATSNIRNGVIIVKDTFDWFFINAQYPLKAVEVFENKVAFVAGENGLIMKSGIDTTNHNPDNPKDSSNSLTPTSLNLQQIQVYPNPLDEISNSIHIEGPIDLDLTSIRLLDSSGRLVREFPGDRRDLTFNNVPKGIYYLHLSTAMDKHTTKIVVSE